MRSRIRVAQTALTPVVAVIAVAMMTLAGCDQEVAAGLDRRTAERGKAVLENHGIEATISTRRAKHTLRVPPESTDDARTVLAAYRVAAATESPQTSSLFGPNRDELLGQRELREAQQLADELMSHERVVFAEATLELAYPAWDSREPVVQTGHVSAMVTDQDGDALVTGLLARHRPADFERFEVAVSAPPVLELATEKTVALGPWRVAPASAPSLRAVLAGLIGLFIVFTLAAARHLLRQRGASAE